MTVRPGPCRRRMAGAIRSIAKDSGGLRESVRCPGHGQPADERPTPRRPSAQAGVVSAAAEQVSKSVQTVTVATKEMNAEHPRGRQAGEPTRRRVAKTGVKVADATNTTVAKLGESSAEIGQVIKVITSIAEQTNLLALNATIERRAWARRARALRGRPPTRSRSSPARRPGPPRTSRGRSRRSRPTAATSSVSDQREIGAIINQINDIQGRSPSAVEEQTLTTQRASPAT